MPETNMSPAGGILESKKELITTPAWRIFPLYWNNLRNTYHMTKVCSGSEHSALPYHFTHDAHHNSNSRYIEVSFHTLKQRKND